MEKERYIGNSKVKEQYNKPLVFVLKDGSVSEKKLAPELRNKINNLQNQIDSIDEHGIAVSNEFGTDQHISISQYTLTGAINKLWQKIEDITGESL